MKDLMILGMPWQFAAAFVLFLCLAVGAIVYAIRVVSFFTFNELVSNGTWKPSKQDMMRKINANKLLTIAYVAVFGVIFVYLIKVKDLFSLPISEMLVFVAGWCLPVIIGMLIFVYILSQLFTRYYINKHYKN